MSEPILIGLTGKRGSGKNTVGEFIKDWAEQNGQKAELQGFADRLKLSFSRIWVPDATLEEALAFCDTIKNIGSIKHDTILPPELFNRFGVKNVISGREALQNYGTEAHRSVFGTDFWVDQLLAVDGNSDSADPNWVSGWSPDIDYAIITDLRFPNEAERIKELGGEVWEVTRPELNAQEDTHASEIPLPRVLVDEGIVNSGTLKELEQLTHKLLDYTFADDPNDVDNEDYIVNIVGK